MALAAWRAELASARRDGWRASLLLRRARELAARAAALLRRLDALPRRTRRRLARRWSLALPAAAFALAWAGGGARAASIEVGEGCTLVDAIHAANRDQASGGCAAGRGADTVVLQGGLFDRHPEVFVAEGFNALPTIASDITIEGNGAVIQSLETPRLRLFHVAPEGRLTLRNVVLEGGFAFDVEPGSAGYGGAILNRGALRLEDSIITGALAERGGGIWNAGRAELLRSELSGNKAHEQEELCAIAALDTLRHDPLAGVRASECGLGGAVFNRGTLVVDNSVLEQNQAAVAGGAVYAGPGSYTHALGAQVYRNTATLGGGIHGQGRLVLEQSGLTFNYAEQRGGGLDLDGHWDARLRWVTLEGNASLGDGGGLAAMGEGAGGAGSALRWTQAYVRRNRATGVGGGVLLGEARALLDDVRIDDNEAEQGAGVWSAGDLTIRGGVIEKNETAARGQGGGVFNAESGALTVLAVDMLDNVAESGGALSNAGAAEVVGGRWTGNRSGYLGGAAANRGHLLLSDCTLSGNSAFTGGAVASRYEGSELELRRSEVSRNQARYRGGGVDAFSTTLRLSDVQVLWNFAERGGGVHGYYTGTTIVGSTISGNSEQGIVNVQGTLSMASSTVSSNTSSTAGGGIIADNVTLQDVRVLDNVAQDGYGGGIIAYRQLVMERSEVRGNVASDGGGGLRLDSLDSAARILESTIHDNRGASGGGINSFGPFALLRSTVADNEAEEGGGIWILAEGPEPVRLERSTLSGNSATGSGGGIKLAYGRLELVGSTLSGNRANALGGALSADGYAVEVRSSTIVGNRAAEGGGFHIGRRAALDLRQSIVSGSAGEDCAGDGHSAGEDNLLDDHDAGLCADLAEAAAVGLDPALAENGGPTLTHALLEGSNALDAVDFVDGRCGGEGDGAAAALDQRGAPRPQDGDGDGEAACDIGAFERAALHTLRVTVESEAGGHGPGSVPGGVLGPAFLGDGIRCGALGEDCAETYPHGLDVALDARPWPGWRARWSGDCDEAGRVTMDADRACALRFERDPTGGPLFLPVLRVR